VVNFTPRPIYPLEKNTGTLQTGGWVGPRVGLDVLYIRKKSLASAEFERRTVQPVAKLLYRLPYCGSHVTDARPIIPSIRIWTILFQNIAAICSLWIYILEVTQYFAKHLANHFY